MKKVVSLVLTMVMVLAMGVCLTDVVGAKEQEDKIEVTEVIVNKSSVKVYIKITSDGKKDVQWGESFILERYENGEWYQLAMRENAGWNDLAHCMYSADGTPAKVAYQTYTLTFLYYRKDLSPGKYRICMDIDFDEEDRYAEFTIPEFKQVKLNKNINIHVNKGTVVKLSANLKKSVKWTSSNRKVAQVSKKGIVTTKKTGTAVIKAKYGKKVLKCKIKVTNIN